MKAAKILTLFVAALAMADVAFSQAWTPTSAPNNYWSFIASSADGGKLIAGGFNWNCSTSTDSGASWTSNSEPQSGSMIGSWYRMASSADGTKLLATSVGSVVWVSTNSGVTWLSNNVPDVIYWGPVAMSADGNTLVAAAGGRSHPPGSIYISTNWGVSWNATSAPTNVWVGVASSTDGTKLIAAAAVPWSGVIYTSTDSGGTWTQAGVPSNYWSAVASSADGSRMVAVYFNATNGVPGVYLPGHIYTSADSGVTWVSNSLVAGNWETVALSADGNTLLAGGQIYNNTDLFVSIDFGVTGTSLLLSSDYFSGYIISIALSADGGKLFAATLEGLIYTSQSVVAPQLNLTLLGGNLGLSWLVPSTEFGLQENSDLATTNWADVTNLPVLNLTNLHNEVFLSPTGSSGFYRLKTPQ